MAITTQITNSFPAYDVRISNSNNSMETHTVQGQLVFIDEVFSQLQLMNLPEHEIKKQLTYRLAEEMMKRNCIQFTRQTDSMTQQTHLRAYAYVCPNDKVALIRGLTNVPKPV